MSAWKWISIGAVSWLALLPLPASAMTAEEVIARHVAARGGAEAWARIDSMKISGTFTAFSKSAPFVLQRKRDRRFHIDHVLDDKRVIIGYDGETAWWDNPWRQAGVQRVAPGPDLQALISRVDFATPLFDHEQLGYRVGLLGEVEFEGLPVIGLELTRPDGAVETWYLDPQTYLEVARLSPARTSGNRWSSEPTSTTSARCPGSSCRSTPRSSGIRETA